MDNKRRGIIEIILSAIAYGTGPIFFTWSFAGGNNSVNAAFLRPIFAILMQLPFMLYKKKSIRVSAKQLRDVILYVGFGLGFTCILLTISYQYIPVSVATPLHYVYPVAVAVIGSFRYKERFTAGKFISLLLCILGTVCFLVNGDGITSSGSGVMTFVGIGLAILSGIVYAFYIQYISHSAIREEIGGSCMLFYANLTTLVLAFGISLILGKITFCLDASAWIYMLIGSFLSNILAHGCFQAGAKEVGGFMASILSTFEPVTGVVLGILLLGESISPIKIIGCVLILSSVLSITYFSRRKNVHTFLKNK